MTFNIVGDKKKVGMRQTGIAINAHSNKLN